MKKLNLLTYWLLLTLLWSGNTLLSQAALDPKWPQFRGPDGRGVAEQAKPPVEFGPETNLLWKVEVPAGHSSPIVLGDRIIFNAAEGKRLLTCALDRKTGRSLWQGEVSVEKLEKFHEVNNAAPCTPATDGERIYSYLPSFGLVAYDTEGQEKWRKPLPLPQTFRGQGSGASPLLAGNLIIVEVPQDSEREVIAIRTSDGTEAWKAVQPLRSMGWATPVRWKDENGDCVGMAFGEQFSAYRLSDGKELWYVTGLGAEACATPVIAGNHVLLSSAGVQGEPANMTLPPEFAEALKLWDKNGDGHIAVEEIPSDLLLTDRKATGGKGNMKLRQMLRWIPAEKNPQGYDRAGWEKMREMVASFKDGAFNRPNLMLVRLGGQGDVTATHVEWQEKRGVPEIPSPLVYKDRIYLVRSGGLVACRVLDSGKLVYDERLGAAGGYFASPLGANGKVYLASDAGVVSVIDAADEFRVLARNDLGEGIFASPAAVEEALYVRSSKHLWAFGR
jgi:outer membrane protein assembly factor BamB